MIKTVKQQVLDRLRQKRVSADAAFIGGSPKSRTDVSTVDVKQFMLSKKNKEENEKFLQDQIEIVEMLERLEDINPKAVSLFIDQAKRKGIYQGMGSSFRRKKFSTSLVTSAIEKSKGGTFKEYSEHVSKLEEQRARNTYVLGAGKRAKYCKYIVQSIDEIVTPK